MGGTLEVGGTLIPAGNYPIFFGITVANLAALALLPNYVAGSLVFVSSTITYSNGTYYVSVPNTWGVADGLNIVTGLNNILWVELHKFESAIYGVTVADLTTLASLPGYSAGYVVRVATVGRLYTSVPTGTSTADGITYITGTGVDWQYIQGTSDAKWLSQATWWIQDGANAENSGIDSSHPIPPDELQRRWGPDPIITTAVTINYSTNCDHFYLHWTRIGTTACVSLIGTTTILQSNCHLTTWTPQNTSTPEETLITSADVADWTPYINKRLNFGGTTGWMRVLAIPHGSPNNVARVNKFAIYQDGNPQHSNTVHTPTVGSIFSIETIPTIGKLGIDVFDSEPMNGITSFSPAFYTRTIATTDSTTVHTSSGDGNWNVRFYDSDLADLVCNQIQAFAGGLLIQKYTTFGPSVNAAVGAMILGVDNGDYAVVFRGCPACFSNFIFQGITVALQAAIIEFLSCGIYDTSAATGYGLLIGDGATVYMPLGNLIGANNSGYGLAIAQNGMLICSGILNLKGTTGDWELTNGLGNLISAFTWANTPYRKFDKGSGTTTLVAGSKAISIESLPSDAIVDVWYTTNNDPQGNISVTSQTTSGFTITSTGSADTNGVGWSWISPSAGVGGIVNN